MKANLLIQVIFLAFWFALSKLLINKNFAEDFLSNYNSESHSFSQSPTSSQVADSLPLPSNYSLLKSLKHNYNSSTNYINNLSLNFLNKSHKNVCQICQKNFKTHNILRQHMRVHTGDKPFTCDVCKKSFSQMASLKYHMATHSDARPYQCEKCEKTYKLKPPIKKHIKECQSLADKNFQDQDQQYNYNSFSPGNSSSPLIYNC